MDDKEKDLIAKRKDVLAILRSQINMLKFLQSKVHAYHIANKRFNKKSIDVAFTTEGLHILHNALCFVLGELYYNEVSKKRDK